MINLDFADVKTIMSGMGFAIMGTGIAEGENRAMAAANPAISSPLLEDASVKGARGVIINVTGGPDLSLVEVSEASAIIQEAAHEDANIIFGAVVDPKMEGQGEDHRHRDRIRSSRRREEPQPVGRTDAGRSPELHRPGGRSRSRKSPPRWRRRLAHHHLAPANARPAVDVRGSQSRRPDSAPGRGVRASLATRCPGVPPPAERGLEHAWPAAGSAAAPANGARFSALHGSRWARRGRPLARLASALAHRPRRLDSRRRLGARRAWPSRAGTLHRPTVP